MAAAEASAVNPLDAHARVLGAQVQSCLRSGDRRSLNGSDDMTIADLLDDTGTLLCSMNGVAGHSGARWPQQMFGEVPHVAADWESERAFSETFRSQAVTAQVSRPTISSTAFCASMFLGVDNRELMPPFVPWGRSEDVLFGRTLRRCRRGAYVADLPFVLQHDPQERAPLSFEAVARQGRVECAYAIGDLCEAVTPLPGQVTADNIVRMGRNFVDLSAGTASALEEVMRVSALRRLTARIGAIEEAMATAPPQVFQEWRRGCMTQLQVLRLLCGERDAWVPLELCENSGSDGRGESTRERIALFGEVLAAWPALWDAAKQLSQEGDAPA